MPCSLTPAVSGQEDFTCPTGATITLTLDAASGAAAEIVQIRYGDTVVASPPFAFQAQPGSDLLVVVIEANEPGVPLQLCESAPEATQTLDQFVYDPKSPARSYIIRALPGRANQ